jgi:D-glycero-alpha-D-manno-heptose 1-phosphate guanylyltransferase
MISHAVILAGGKGTRLMPLTAQVPKPMVSVAGKPFLYWQLRYLQAQGINDVLLLVSHLHEVLRDYWQSNPLPNLRIRFAIEDQPMGTGGALRQALAQLPEQFWLLNGDSFLPLDMPAMAKSFASPSALMAVVEKSKVPVPGNVQTEGATVTRYEREAGLPMVDAGVYLLNRTLIEQAAQGAFDLGTLWQPVIARRELAAFYCPNPFYDIGTIERLEYFVQQLPSYFT